MGTVANGNTSGLRRAAAAAAAAAAVMNLWLQVAQCKAVEVATPQHRQPERKPFWNSKLK